MLLDMRRQWREETAEKIMGEMEVDVVVVEGAVGAEDVGEEEVAVVEEEVVVAEEVVAAEVVVVAEAVVMEEEAEEEEVGVVEEDAGVNFRRKNM
jgi:hypothetical protein